jgi:nucleotide-binding universal stress UspA family protein
MTLTRKISKRGRHPATVPTVLCGTDFSSNARLAANIAGALAHKLRGRVEVAHVTVIPAFPPVRKDLNAEAERLRQRGLSVKAALLNGNADEELVKRAQVECCRMIVLASLGKRRSERWLLGSVSERTAERASVPTLVVRDAAPFEAWTRGERPLKVFVAFNFTATSEAALRWVKELQAIGPCDLVVGYVDWPPEQRTRLGGGGPLPLEDNPPAMQVVLERDLKARVAELLGEAPFRLRVEANGGRPDAGLANMAREEGADLLVVGSNQFRGFERLWHTSVSRGLLHSATMSVAVVPLSTRHKRGTDPATSSESGAVTQRMVKAKPTSKKGRGGGELGRKDETLLALSRAFELKQIVVPIDFSNTSHKALQYAVPFAAQFGARLLLIHVIERAALPTELGYVPPEVENASQIAMKGALERRAALCQQQLGAKCFTQTRVRMGVPWQEITAAAKESAADLIIIATHGRAGLKQVLLGSTAERVVRHAPCPVLVVREHEREFVVQNTSKQKTASKL